jgi:hypothetical protein
MGAVFLYFALGSVGVALIVAFLVSFKTGRMGDFVGVFFLTLLLVGVVLWFFAGDIHGVNM